MTVSESVLNSSNNSQSNQSSSGYYLCMSKSEVNSLEYNPVGFYDTSSTNEAVLVPICMSEKACLSYMTELDPYVKVYASSICNDSSASKRFDSEQVLQLIKRY